MMKAPTPNTLEGKSILITGGASGIGRASADLLAAAGAYVTVVDIQAEQIVGQEIIQHAKLCGQHVNYVQCDTRDWHSQVAAFQSAANFSPQRTLDVAILSAGVVSDPGSLVEQLLKQPASLEHPPSAPDLRCIDINLTGVYYSTQLALHYMRGASSGLSETDQASTDFSKSLIFIDSMAGYFDFPKDTGYNVSKHGCRALFRSIRSTTRVPLGVRCNLIAPWFVKTPLTAALQDVIPGGKGITWTNLDDVTLAIHTCIVNDGIDGRSFAVLPEGIFDLQDDLKTGFGGEVLQKLYALRQAAGDVII